MIHTIKPKFRILHRTIVKLRTFCFYRIIRTLIPLLIKAYPIFPETLTINQLFKYHFSNWDF